MARYHIGRDGQPHVCKAQEGQCPLGGEHYDDLKECERAAEKQFKVKKSPFSKKRGQESIRSLPDQVYLRNYIQQYGMSAGGVGAPLVIKKDGEIYAVVKENTRTGRKELVSPKYHVAEHIAQDDPDTQFSMIPLRECTKDLNTDETWYDPSALSRYSLHPYTNIKNKKLKDPVELESGGLKNTLKGIDDKIGGDSPDALGEYLVNQKHKMANDPNNPIGQAIRRM